MQNNLTLIFDLKIKVQKVDLYFWNLSWHPNLHPLVFHWKHTVLRRHNIYQIIEALCTSQIPIEIHSHKGFDDRYDSYAVTSQTISDIESTKGPIGT